MQTPAAAPRDPNGLDRPEHRTLALLILGGLGLLLAVTVVVAVTSVDGADRPSGGPGTSASAEQLRRLPPTWRVRRGDTYAEIAVRTGLTVEQLEALNPRIDPAALQPGQRLRLRPGAFRAKPRPTGPQFHLVRAGESFASVAAKTGRSVARLRRLNPRLRPAALQPGDRIRLR